jgi:hypothetical protein
MPRNEAVDHREGREHFAASNYGEVVDGALTGCINTAPLRLKIFFRIAFGNARKIRPNGKSSG